MNLNLEQCRLSCKVCCLILLRESNVYIYVIPCILSNQLLLEIINESVGTDL